MTDFLTQSHALAQGDMDQWVDLLILVLVGVFYAVAGLIKNARRKPQEAQRDGSAKERRVPAESWPRRLARKAEELQRAAEAKGRETAERVRQWEQQARMREPMTKSQPRRGPVSQSPRPEMGKVVVRPGRGGESTLTYERDESDSDAARRRHAAQQQPTSVALEPVAAGGLGIDGATAVLEPVGYDPASIIDYNDPDALRKAILHYEILGKPVGLRDSFEHSATL